jgi:MFS transporter, DHA1 family, inner membrane transport protein
MLDAVPPRRVLPALALAQLAGTSSWFAVNAVMADLQASRGWPASAVGTLTAAVQIGFIAGALLFGVLALADRFAARHVFLACALGAAACTLGARGADSLAALWGWRAATGFCLAGIYPVGMKLAAMWFPRGLGAALGVLLGALVVGSASPHALRALTAGAPWTAVFDGVALASAFAGAIVMLAIPEPPAGTRAPALQPSALWAAMRDWRLRASVFGYFGHMVELYTMWVLVPAILATRLGGTALSAAAFLVLGAGALGCIGGGMVVRHFGSAWVATAQLACSGLCCISAPLWLAAPDRVFYGVLLLWGITVAGDSPQFSALTAANAPRAAIGSVLTLTNSIGFAISIASITLFVALAQHVPLAALLPWLGIGPALGVWAMRPLLRR